MDKHADRSHIKALALENRLIGFAVKVCRIAEDLPSTKIGNHVAMQLIRSCTAPAANYGEAQSAESRRDFIHKMKICLKELREVQVWLKFILEQKDMNWDDLDGHLAESNELIAIFVKSIETASKNLQQN